MDKVSSSIIKAGIIKLKLQNAHNKLYINFGSESENRSLLSLAHSESENESWLSLAHSHLQNLQILLIYVQYLVNIFVAPSLLS